FFMSYNASSERATWTGVAQPMDVRLRLAAKCHVVSEGLTVDRLGRQRLLAALQDNAFDIFVRQWATRKGLAIGRPQWNVAPERDGYNDNRHACYQLCIHGQHGHPAITVDVRLVLPGEISPALLANLDLPVAFTPTRPVVRPPVPVQIPASLPTGRSDVREFLRAGWPPLANLPLAATPDPRAIPPAGPSTLEFHISSERTVR